MISIELGDYQIHVGDIWKSLQTLLQARDYSQLIVLVDENTKAHCLPLLQQHTNLTIDVLIEIQSGERHKNLETCQHIWQAMMDANTNRNAVLLNLGGGVIGDMGGFCAATFKRGIDFIQIPTTLLSQVDASIGGKLGIDFGQIKNSIGLFCNPQAVFINPECLKTLSTREIRSGFAELIKHSLIADRKEWETLQQIERLEDIVWDQYLVPSLKIKKEIVAADPFEKSIRKALNYGHTIGHAIESFALHTKNPLLHGEAVAIGMLCEAYLSQQIAGFPVSDLVDVRDFILRIYGKYQFEASIFEELLHFMKKDKKNEGTEINFTMLKSPGEALINQTCSPALIVESLEYYLKA